MKKQNSNDSKLIFSENPMRLLRSNSQFSNMFENDIQRKGSIKDQMKIEEEDEFPPPPPVLRLMSSVDYRQNSEYKIDKYLLYPPMLNKQQSQYYYIPQPTLSYQNSTILPIETNEKQPDKPTLKKQKSKTDTQIQTSKKDKRRRKAESKEFEGPCFCSNSGCLKRYCRCFHNGIMCSDKCQCTGCKNNDEHIQERNQAVQHVNTKCHRNKKVPKNALFELKVAYGCNCKKTNCKKNYCECFLRGQQCTVDCECENCENGQDEAFQRECLNKNVSMSSSSRRKKVIT